MRKSIPHTESLPSPVLVFMAIYATPTIPRPRNIFWRSEVFSLRMRDSQIQQETGRSESTTPAVMPEVVAIPSVSNSI